MMSLAGSHGEVTATTLREFASPTRPHVQIHPIAVSVRLAELIEFTVQYPLAESMTLA